MWLLQEMKILTTPRYPAAYDNAISVAATDNDDVRAYFSNYGTTIDVSAPGVSIYSTNLGGGYRTLSGTSMAGPHVAGLAALMLSKNPLLSVNDIENLLESTADGSWGSRI